MSRLRGYNLVKGIVNLVSRFPLASRVAEALPRDRCVVVAFGKSAYRMIEPVEDGGVTVEGGIVVVPHGYTGRRPPGMEVVEASHPVPDEASLRAGRAVLEWARASRSVGCLLALISGGGSALVEYPMDPITLEDVRAINRLLLASGASIHEINTVRKHISLVKGGRLAGEAYPARVYGLYASDVPGDRIDSIASGPTAPDPTTYRDALDVLERYGITGEAPERVVKVLREGVEGKRPETPKPGSEVFERVSNSVVAANIDVLKSIGDLLRGKGINPLILTSRLEGESREAGRVLASITMEAVDRGIPVGRTSAILAGGETSVRVRNPNGRGGRNMELAVSWAHAMWYWGYRDEAIIVSLDTDGIDGNTDAAGAYMAPGDVDTAKSLGLDPVKALDENNTYKLLEELGRLVKTGPTQVNLNSVTVILVGPPGEA
ncbi:MAG: glycerate kinase [Desulfurococcales archaeon]|nr:glycerate kinase [Desulfurococcales archaeon]